MLGILLIYFIGKRFYDLAFEFDKNKWLYAILGIMTYYATGAIFILLIALLDVYIYEWNFDWDSSVGMNLLVVPSGLLGTYALYIVFKNNWKKSTVVIIDEIDDIGNPSI